MQSLCVLAASCEINQPADEKNPERRAAYRAEQRKNEDWERVILRYRSQHR